MRAASRSPSRAANRWSATASAIVFETIAQSWRDQSMGLARLLAFSSGYVTLAGVLPILVGTPRFLEGALSLGRLIQSGQAFQQVTAALSWPVDNLALIAGWRASVERVLMLDEAVRIVALEAARTGRPRSTSTACPTSQLGVRDLWVAAPDGTAMLSDLTLEVEPGEHVLVDGDPEAASALFRVLAGIWPWGRGRVDLPADAGMIAVGPWPFLPQGSLRQALAFPEAADRHDDAALQAALASVGPGASRGAAGRVGRLGARADRGGGAAAVLRADHPAASALDRARRRDGCARPGTRPTRCCA